MLNWRKGRQAAKYDVLDVWKIPFRKGGGTDCAIIKYEGPCDLPMHKDKVEDGLRHFRLNIVFGAKGEFRIDSVSKVILNWRGRVILFRPDIQFHGMKLDKGKRYVLSFGVAI